VTFEGRYYRLEGVGLQPKPPARRRAHLRRQALGRGLRRAGRRRRLDRPLGLAATLHRAKGSSRRRSRRRSGPAEIEMGLQVWIGVHEDGDVARALLGSRMETFTPALRVLRALRTPRDAGAHRGVLAPYIGAGARISTSYRVRWSLRPYWRRVWQCAMRCARPSAPEDAGTVSRGGRSFVAAPPWGRLHSSG
jgi:hypothetical protein